MEMSRIYSSIQTTVVPTGRIAFTDPNLQSITHSVSFESMDNINVTVSIRDSFIPCQGCVFMSVDYSQLEVRILAHLSKDKDLIQLLNADGDIFKLIAGQWLNKDVIDIGSMEREQAKHICYGILYGMGPRALSTELKVSKTVAIQFIDSFKARYQGYIIYIYPLHLVLVNSC
jgi:DNA polymerase theta